MRYTLQLIVLLFNLTCMHAQDNAKEWAFVNREEGYGRFIKQGQVLTVKWHDQFVPHISKGKLMDLTEDSVRIQVEKQRYQSIAKADVDQINYRRPGMRILGCFLMVAGILFACVILLYQLLFDATRLDYQIANGERTKVWPLAILGGLVLILGIAKLNSSFMKISKPFEKEWVLKELSDTPSNLP